MLDQEFVVHLDTPPEKYEQRVDIDEVSRLIEQFPANPAIFIETVLERSLSSKQKLFVDSTLTFNHVVAIWSRQTGKSTVIASYIVWRLLFGTGCTVHGEHINENIVVVAPIKEQVNNIYAKIDILINRSEYIEKYIVKRNTQKIIAKNGNMITFISASPGSHIRGATATCIVIDETQDVLDSKYYADIMPFGSTTNALIIEAGTPKTKNHFYATMKSKNVKVIRQMYFECPFLSEEFIQEQKDKMPEALFRQEYLCEFIEEGVLAFPSRLFEPNKDVESKQYGKCNIADYDYITKIEQLTEEVRIRVLEDLKEEAVYSMGQDLGRQNDHTEIAVFRIDRRPIKLELHIRFPLGEDYMVIARKAALIYKMFQPVEFNLDYTSEKSFVDALRAEGVAIVLDEEIRRKKSPQGRKRLKNVRGGIAFTQKVKTEMINNARVLLEKYELQFPGQAEVLLSQFMNQQFEYNEETKKYKYYHPSNENDDGLWACLLALKNIRVTLVDDKVKFVNPWEKYDDAVHNKNSKDAVYVKSNYARRKDSYRPSNLRRSQDSFSSSLSRAFT